MAGLLTGTKLLTGRGMFSGGGLISLTQAQRDAMDYIARVKATGANFGSASNEAAVMTLFSTLSAQPSGNAGVSNLQAIKAGCLLAGPSTLAGALVPLYPSMPAPTNVGFVAGDYHRVQGLQGNGTKYLSSGRMDNADPITNNHASVFVTAGGTLGLLGSGSGLTNERHIYDGYPSTGQVWVSSASEQIASTSNTGINTTGFIGVSRSASGSFTLRRNGGNETKLTTAKTASANPVQIFSRGSNPYNGRIAAYTIGESVDLAALDSAMTAYMAALSVSSAELDAQNYRDLLAANGKTLADADFSALVSFASQLYATIGRQDFLTLRSSQNMGTGSTAYTWLGLPVTLINGPTWGANGLVVNSGAQRASAPIVFSAVPSYTTVAVVRDTGNTAQYPCITGADTGTGVNAGASLVCDVTGQYVVFDSFNNASRISGTQVFTNGNTVMTSGTVRGGTAQEIHVNGALISQATIAAAPASFNKFWFMSRQDQDFGRNASIYPFFATWPVGVTAAQSLAIYNLYSSTIGLGVLPTAQVMSDAAAYRSLLSANGKTLADADYSQLVDFATQLYALAGRQDFITLRSAQNKGSGSTAYTWLGKSVSLVNGPSWGTDGLTFAPGSGSYLSFASTPVPAAPAALFMADSGYNLSGDFSAPVRFGGTFNSGQRGWQSLSNSLMFACNGTRADVGGYGNTIDTHYAQVVPPATNLASYVGMNGTTAVSAASGTANWDSLSVNTTSISGPSNTSYAGTAKLSFLLCAGIDLRANYTALRTAYKSTIGSGLGIP